MVRRGQTRHNYRAEWFAEDNMKTLCPMVSEGRVDWCCQPSSPRCLRARPSARMFARPSAQGWLAQLLYSQTDVPPQY